MEILDEYSTRLEKAALRLLKTMSMKSEFYSGLPISVRRLLDEETEAAEEEWKTAIDTTLHLYKEGQLNLEEFAALFYSAYSILESQYHY